MVSIQNLGLSIIKQMIIFADLNNDKQIVVNECFDENLFEAKGIIK